MQKQPSEGFSKNGVMRNFAELTRQHLCPKLKSVDLQLH